jgi:lambda repressor-like predicted transcriptional regulator
MSCSAQNFQLRIIGSSASETKTIDSLKYSLKHKNLKSLNDEVNRVSEKLSKTGYIENKILETIKAEDSSYTSKIKLGKRIKFIHIYIGRNSELKEIATTNPKSDTIVIPYEELEIYLNNIIQKLEQKGFSLAELKLKNIQIKKNTLFADLSFQTDKQRTLNSIVIKTNENKKKISFPEGYLEQINRKYLNKTFNTEILKQIYNDFEKFGFVKQIKYPEILFTADTTKAYVYLEKRKSNVFDGFIGFSNNESSKLAFNGYLNITLENTLHSGELFSLYWKNDENKQKTFKTNLELPYIFKTPIGLKANLTIFKQDSTYQNTNTGIDLGYFINYNTRIYLGYQSTESSDIQNTNIAKLSDYKNSYLTSEFQYSKNDNNNPLFPKKSTISFTTGFGKRNSNNQPETESKTKQFYVNLEVMHNFYLNKKNSINIKSQNYFLQSDNYIINELFRFGGINSIRGFEESSLQANFLTSILTEYRYTLSPSLYIHSIIDYGTYKDRTATEENKQKTSLIALGLGLGLQTSNGLLKLVFANGKNNNNNLTFSNTIVHICYNVKF